MRAHCIIFLALVSFITLAGARDVNYTIQATKIAYIDTRPRGVATCATVDPPPGSSLYIEFANVRVPPFTKVERGSLDLIVKSGGMPETNLEVFYPLPGSPLRVCDNGSEFTFTSWDYEPAQVLGIPDQAMVNIADGQIFSVDSMLVLHERFNNFMWDYGDTLIALIIPEVDSMIQWDISTLPTVNLNYVSFNTPTTAAPTPPPTQPPTITPSGSGNSLSAFLFVSIIIAALSIL